MRQRHQVLISISIDFVSGAARLKSLPKEMIEIGTITAASSVYKRYLNERQEDLNSELVLVLKVETLKSDLELFHFLKLKEKFQDRLQLGRSEFFILLCFDQRTRMVPGQNLPNILLWNDPLVLRCAAEAWGDYEHPVLGKSLNEIVGSQEISTSVEFFSQFVIDNNSIQSQEQR